MTPETDHGAVRQPADAQAKSELPAPAVPASAYDSPYYLETCMGSKTWRESGGREVFGLYPFALEAAGMQPGWRVLDIGTGRGEVVRAAIDMGAAEALGVDYSPEAIEIARETLRVAGDPPNARVEVADARRVPAETGHFDLVTMLDVVEHLTQRELHDALLEAGRVLRPGGRIFIHTMPNALVYETTYRLQRALRPKRARRWPRDPRNEFERAMHVNEQTPGRLRRALREAGFSDARVTLGDFVYTEFVPEERPRRLYRRLARIPGLRRFAIADLFAIAARP